MSERGLKIERDGAEIIITIIYPTAIEAHAAYTDFVEQAGDGRIVIEEEED